MYAIQGLWTAAQLKLPITFIIVNNRRYEALLQFGRHFGLARTVGTSLPDIDFRGLAVSQGCNGMRVEHVDALDDALRAALAAPEAVAGAQPAMAGPEAGGGAPGVAGSWRSW